MEPEIEPHGNDIVAGRGSGSNRHKGNMDFRALIKKNKARYLSLNKNLKMDMAREILAEIESADPPGRFLQKNPETGAWFQVAKPRALEKISQALREKSHAKKGGGPHDLPAPEQPKVPISIPASALVAGPKEKAATKENDAIRDEKQSVLESSIAIVSPQEINTPTFPVQTAESSPTSPHLQLKSPGSSSTPAATMSGGIQTSIPVHVQQQGPGTSQTALPVGAQAFVGFPQQAYPYMHTPQMPYYQMMQQHQIPYSYGPPQILSTQGLHQPYPYQQYPQMGMPTSNRDRMNQIAFLVQQEPVFASQLHQHLLHRYGNGEPQKTNSLSPDEEADLAEKEAAAAEKEALSPE